jgi:hypothetical protein
MRKRKEEDDMKSNMLEKRRGSAKDANKAKSLSVRQRKPEHEGKTGSRR